MLNKLFTFLTWAYLNFIISLILVSHKDKDFGRFSNLH